MAVVWQMAGELWCCKALLFIFCVGFERGGIDEQGVERISAQRHAVRFCCGGVGEPTTPRGQNPTDTVPHDLLSVRKSCLRYPVFCKAMDGSHVTWFRVV